MKVFFSQLRNLDVGCRGGRRSSPCSRDGCRNTRDEKLSGGGCEAMGARRSPRTKFGFPLTLPVPCGPQVSTDVEKIFNKFVSVVVRSAGGTGHFTLDLVRSLRADTPPPARPRHHTTRAGRNHTLSGRAGALVVLRCSSAMRIRLTGLGAGWLACARGEPRVVSARAISGSRGTAVRRSSGRRTPRCRDRAGPRGSGSESMSAWESLCKKALALRAYQT